MIGLSEPWWLIALISIPIVWWLHRFHYAGNPYHVSALFLWRSATDITLGGTEPDKADKRWWLRASIILILSLALAGPYWQSLAILQHHPSSPQAEIGRISLRPAIHADNMRGLVSIINPLQTPIQSSLVLEPIDKHYKVGLPAFSEKNYHFSLDTIDSKPLVATLANGDKLSLAVDKEFPVSIVGKCGHHLLTTLSVIPGIKIHKNETGALLTINCSAQRNAALPQLWLRKSVAEHSNTESDIPLWHVNNRSLNQLSLDSVSLRLIATPSTNSAQALLSSGTTPLITLNTIEGKQLIEILIDMEFPALVNRPEYPRLVAALIELATGHSLPGIQYIERPKANTIHADQEQTTPIHLAMPLIILAIALLLLDSRGRSVA